MGVLVSRLSTVGLVKLELLSFLELVPREPGLGSRYDYSTVERLVTINIVSRQNVGSSSVLYIF